MIVNFMNPCSFVQFPFASYFNLSILRRQCKPLKLICFLFVGLLFLLISPSQTSFLDVAPVDHDIIVNKEHAKEGSSATCRRSASICCLRASLEKSCELGSDMGRAQGYCSNTVNILGGGLRKECCDCCILGKELAEQGEQCEAPVGFSAYCLKSFQQCCEEKKTGRSPSPLVSNAVQENEETESCKNAGCQHLCAERTNGFECSCRAGYDLASDGKSCIDVDECSGDPMCLEPNTQCLNTEGTYQCVCQMGFYWSSAGFVCVDIDECLLLVDECLESQRCLNTPGSYKCIRTLSCGTGYAMDSETEQCVDVDECNLGAHDCGPLYRCRNIPGSYRCDPKQCRQDEVMDPSTGECTSVSCPAGYEAKDGRYINECLSPRRCGSYEECINTQGSYRCQEKGNLCASGYKMDQESGFCLDIDECLDGTHTCGKLQCINMPGSFKCRCAAGYEFNETTKHCEDVDECKKFQGHICSQHATCENTIGSFNCHCKSGYKLAADKRHCDDVDECSNGEARCQQRCINTPGSYQCLCDRGYQLSSNELTCEDINECEAWTRNGNQLCMGSCINIPGSFQCTCPTGYRLQEDSITCKDIDECAEIGCPDKENQVCVNTLGDYRCQTITCPKNYAPDRHYKNRCNRKPNVCTNPDSERCKRHPVHISWQHISIPKHVNISAQRTSITLFSMKGPASINTTMQFELRLISAASEASGVLPAVRENFLIQKGDDRNSAVIALRDSLDGPQEVQLELVLRLSTNGEFSGKYMANLNVYVSKYSYVDDGYSCLKKCNTLDNSCLSNYTKEIMYQYRNIPSISDLDAPLEISRVTVVMEVAFRSEFILNHRNRRNFQVKREGDNVGIISLLKPIKGPRTEMIRIIVNNRSPRGILISNNLIFIEVHVSANDF
ncbi:Fibulin-1 [Aphelenchoides bicaudatus]|nr:Fibulin-1 [Aphelenchoides bicaudatus]